MLWLKQLVWVLYGADIVPLYPHDIQNPPVIQPGTPTFVEAGISKLKAMHVKQLVNGNLPAKEL